MKKLIALVSILIVVLASCRPEGGMNADAGYFSITALRDSLAKGKPVYKFKKTLVVDGKSETQTITDSLHTQIAFFEHFEINKPSYRGAYIVDTLPSPPDTAGVSAKVVEYKRKAEFKYPVTNVVYKVNGSIITVSALSKEKNLLTTITKQLVVNTDSKGFAQYTYSVKEEMQGSEPTNTQFILERVY